MTLRVNHFIWKANHRSSGFISLSGKISYVNEDDNLDISLDSFNRSFTLARSDHLTPWDLVNQPILMKQPKKFLQKM